MRIRTKITGLVAGVLSLAWGACSIFAVNQYMIFSVEKVAAAEREKLELVERVFVQTGTKEELDGMGEIARDAYLEYQFERCYQKGYALLEGQACIKNLTEYDISAPEALRDPYTVQKLGETYLLLMKKELPYPRGFWVMSVKNITSTWVEGRQQAKGFLVMFLFVFVVSVGGAAAIASHMLKALEKLRAQAEQIRRGDFNGRVILTSRDELKALSDSLNSMSDQIRQQIEDLELLLGAMAHEMKTPLTNILGYADSLLHVRLTERQREQSLEAICRSAGRLNQMSGKLLQLVGLYENQEIETRPVDLEEVIQCVYEENKEKLDAKNVDFQILRRDNMRIDKTHLRKVTEPARQEKGAVVVQGDPLLLISLFGNLVSNSMKALEVGGRIQVILDENRQSVCVRDNGRGIPKEALPHVTKAFYMADKSRSRRQQGSGLGLALAERIVKAHHGEMEIESRMGEGTEVTVTFGDMRQERSKSDKEKAGR